jgi:hypothetical protein
MLEGLDLGGKSFELSLLALSLLVDCCPQLLKLFEVAVQLALAAFLIMHFDAFLAPPHPHFAIPLEFRQSLTASHLHLCQLHFQVSYLVPILFEALPILPILPTSLLLVAVEGVLLGDAMVG